MAFSPILFFAGLIALVLLIALAIILIGKTVQGVGWIFRHIGRFVIGEFADLLGLIGALLTALVLVPLVLGSVIIGRWSGAAHFTRACAAELGAVCASAYRMLIGRPLELLLLTPVTEGLGRRLPEVLKAAPGRDTPTPRTGQFDGYTIVGSLKGGGSGSKLYIAEPDEIRRAAFERQGHAEVDRVVIKTFSLKDGSSLPQIVRESRALDAAKKLDLVLDHQLTDERFHYVMRYVPGEPLGLVTQRIHAASGADGLDHPHLRQALRHVDDLISTLSAYHQGGLWHKDVKPDNIIVNRSGAHLVDLGLVTPLRSAMTLTTHGTEYFRDPELVRMALRGVKVHQVDGARFDIYAAGAVLYSVLENSFPAHGGLSQVTKRCPEAVRWIVRRAMTEYDNRYETAQDMLADLRVVLDADDPFAVKPADLPSVAGGHTSEGFEPEPAHEPEPAALRPDALVWELIREFEGAHFQIKRGGDLTYEIHGDALVPSRTEYMLPRKHFEWAAAQGPVSGPGAYDNNVRGPSYIWAILHDPRISHRLWGERAAGASHQQPRRRHQKPATAPSHPPKRERPRISVTNWWTGQYRVEPSPGAPVARAGSPRPAPVERRPAHEQLEHARSRAQAARERVRARRTEFVRKRAQRRPASPNAKRRASRPRREAHPSNAAATLVGFLVILGLLGLLFLPWNQQSESHVGALAATDPATPPTPAQGDAPDGAAPPAPQATPRPDSTRQRASRAMDTAMRSQASAFSAPPGASASLPAALLALYGVNAMMAQHAVLIVNEAPLTPDRVAQVEAVVDGLRGLGVTIRGNPLSTKPGPDALRDAIADAIYRINQAPDTDSITDEMSRWIHQTPDIDYVLWFPSGAGQSGSPPAPRLFEPPPGDTRAEQIYRAMVTAGLDHAMRSAERSSRGG